MKVIIFLLLLSPFALASETHYDSGLLNRFEIADSQIHTPEQEAVAGFIQSRFATLNKDFSWRVVDRAPDGTHVHYTYQLYYKGWRVLDQMLKVHYSLRGFVQYASNELSFPFSVEIPSDSSQKHNQFETQILENWADHHGAFVGKLTLEPVIWLENSHKTARAAFLVLLSATRPLHFERYIIDAKTGEVLQTQMPYRSSNPLVYLVSPYNGSSPVDVASTLSFTWPTTLSSSYLHVRYMHNSATPSCVEVTPADYTSTSNPMSDSYNSTGDSYKHDCLDSSTDCPDQAFDADQIYFHLTQYRTRIQNYLTALGASVTFAHDPLNIIVNPLTLDIEGTGNPANQSNNALYVGQDCGSDGNGNDMDHCIVFLKPAVEAPVAQCGDVSAQFYDLARETIVGTHEYQHYVTDSITHIAFGGSSTTTVGDALHEGYSDYLAASYVSDLSGQNVTLVGQYALQNCTGLQRQLATLRVDPGDSSDSDPHTSGLSWASSLWELRTELGMTTMDKLALKSEFFLPTAPGIVDAVEALVQADQALNGGANVSRIRTLLYSTVHFGTSSPMFQDPANGIANVGLSGCSSVPLPFSRRGALATLALFLTWLTGTLVIGRKRNRAA